MPATQLLAGFGHGSEFAFSDLCAGNGVVSEGREAAVGVEKHAVSAEHFDRAFGSGDDLIGSFDGGALLVNHTKADATVFGVSSN